MQKTGKPDSGLKRLWKSSSNEEERNRLHERSGLPLLQVWPSQDSPRGEADGQSFVFQEEESIELNVLGSPSADTNQDSLCSAAATSCASPVVSRCRRASSALLHPEHARLMARPPLSPTLSLDQTHSGDEGAEPVMTSGSSSVSSLNSVTAAGASRASDPMSRRRSSTVTTRYSLFDALDLEYAIIRAAARGSIGPYSLSQSLQKLTFTQSLAFPALARGLASKRRSSTLSKTQKPLDPNDSGLNVFAKVVTALLLMLISVIVFGVVYKYVRT